MAVSSMVAVVWRSGLKRTAGRDADAAAGTTVTPSPHSTMAICEVTDRARCAGTGLNPAARHMVAMASW